MARKRTRGEMEASEPLSQAPQEASLISKIRNMWEFASVNQYIHTFGKAVKLDNDFDIQVRDQFHCLCSPTAAAGRTPCTTELMNLQSTGLRRGMRQT